MKNIWKRALIVASMLAAVLGLTACANAEGDGFGFTFDWTYQITGLQAILVLAGIAVVAAIVVVILKATRKRK